MTPEEAAALSPAEKMTYLQGRRDEFLDTKLRDHDHAIREIKESLREGAANIELIRQGQAELRDDLVRRMDALVAAQERDAAVDGALEKEADRRNAMWFSRRTVGLAAVTAAIMALASIATVILALVH